MPLIATVSRDCNFIDINVSYTNASSYPFTGTLSLTDINGDNILPGAPSSLTIASQFDTVNIVIPISTYFGNGIVNIEFMDGSTVIYTHPVLLHCDIDCCLAKLTNELIDCACDCAKCASSLAKAQKIFLLIKSAEYALAQAQSANSGNVSGYLLDAHNKYIKAKQICDDSCGCNC